MVRIAAQRMNELVFEVENGASAHDRGHALEEMVCYIVDKVPGVRVTYRNVLNTAGSQEIDIAAWNDQHPNGWPFLPHVLLFECKNWTASVGSQEVAWFDHKVRTRGLDLGVIVAANGVTGDAQDLTAAHNIISAALHEQRRLIVLDLHELAVLRESKELVELTKEKLCLLAVSGTSIRNA